MAERVFEEWEIVASSLSNPVVCWSRQDAEDYVGANLVTDPSVVIKKIIRTESVHAVYPALQPWPKPGTGIAFDSTQEVKTRIKKK